MTRSVCFLCNEYPPALHGGVGTFVQAVASELHRAGWSVRVAGLYRNWDSAREDFDGGVRVLRLPFPERDVGGVLARRRLYRVVAEWSRAREIDLVEVPDAEGWNAGWPPLTVPVIARVHGSCTYFARELGRRLRPIDYLLERAAMRRADYWCSVSEYAAEKTRKVFGLRPADAISYIPVRPPEPPRERRSRNTVLFTGTLTPKKGIVQLIRAWPGVLAQEPDAELHVYGKDRPGGGLQERLMEMLRPEVRGSVRFFGHRKRAEVMQALATARTAIFPSYAEAFACAPVEAMACECPTIYSCRTSGTELIDHNRNGLLIDPDDVPGITNAIVRVLKDDELAERLGHAGRESVRERLNPEKVAAEIADFYRRCIAGFGAAHTTTAHSAAAAS